MKAIIIDDDERLVRALRTRLRAAGGLDRPASVNDGLVVNYEKNHPREIARRISLASGGDPKTVVFINLNLRCAGRRRQQYAGAEVLKYLRTSRTFYDQSYTDAPNRARAAHCVVYSFFDLEAILRQHPENLILCSEGTTLLRLPGGLEGLSLSRLAEREARADSLVPYVRGELTLPDERHEWANWWGVRQLWEVHKQVESEPRLRYQPNKLYELIQDLQSQQAVYLYGHSDEALGTAYREHAGDITLRRGRLALRWPRVLHIDDKWEEGWSKVFMQMIYGRGLSPAPPRDPGHPASLLESYALGSEQLFHSFKAFEPAADGRLPDKAACDELSMSIERALVFGLEQGVDVILLDLRLFAERGAYQDVTRLSGARVLEHLRSKFWGIPVIMTTASNKVWSMEQLSRAGADGYWIKGGVDERRTPAEVVKNYLHLLELVDKVTGEEYQFLKKFDRAVTLLEGNRRWWCEEHHWPKPPGGAADTTRASREAISRILKDTILMLRSYLQQHVMGTGFQTKESEWCWTSAIIRHAANALEEVHRFNDFETLDRSSFKIQGRRDGLAANLYNERNKASHFNRAVTIDWKLLKLFLTHVICYLHYGPQPRVNYGDSLKYLGKLEPDYLELYKKLDKVA